MPVLYDPETPTEEPRVVGPTTLSSRIGVIEQASFGTLPASLVYSGALVSTHDEEAAHFAVTIARHLDLPVPPVRPGRKPHTPAPVIDPYTGDSISLRRAKQLMALGAAIAQQLSGTGQQRRRAPVDPLLTTAYIQQMDGVADVPAQFALAYAMDMSRTKVDGTKFGNNIRVIADWNGNTNTLSEEEALVMARWWSENRGSTITPGNIVNLIDPALADAITSRETSLSSLPEGYSIRGIQAQDFVGAQELEKLYAAREKAIQNPNYLKDAQAILGNINTPNWFERQVSWVSDNVLQPLWYGGQRLFLELEGAVRPEINAAIAALPGGEQGVREAWRDSIRYRSFQIQRLNEGRSLGQQYVEDLGLPSWAGAGLDFLIGWETDPFILGGKLLAGARALRTLPELETASTIGRALTPNRLLEWEAARQVRNFEGSAVRFARSTQSRALFDSAFGDEAGMLRLIDRGRDSVEARSALDMEFMHVARAELLAKYAAPTEKAWAEWQNIIRAHFGIQPAEGSVAQRVLDRMAGESAAAEQTSRTVTQTGEGLVVSQPAISTETIAQNTAALALRGEVPQRLLPIPGFGLTKLARLRFGESALGESRFGIAERTIFNRDPGPIFRPGVNPQDFLYRKGVRWRAFSDTELRGFQARALEITTSSSAPERDLVGLLEEMNREGERRVLQGLGASEEGISSIIDDITLRYRGLNRQTVFAELPEGNLGSRVIGRPLLESQLVDEVVTIDPVLFRKLARRYTGTIRGMVDALGRSLGGVIPDEALAKIARDAYKGIDFGGELAHGVARSWKFLVVPRPAYIGRVILGDENLRFLATTNSLLERVAALPFQGPLGHIVDRLVPDEIIRVGDAEIVIRRAGTFGYEPLANQSFRDWDALDDLIRRTGAEESSLKSLGVYGGVNPGDPQHLAVWQRNLNLQLGNSIPGRIALKSIMDGESISETRAALVQWANTEGRRLIHGRLGIPPGDVDEWADALSRMAHTYTMERADIADLALHRSVTDEILAAAPTELQPTVHGPLVESLTNAAGSAMPLKRTVEHVYKAFVSRPENFLNRQPFYRVWKRRAERGMLRVLADQGVEATPDVLSSIDNASRQFALAQVKQVMFDFTESSRLGELGAMVLPFTQPWAEAYQAWGNILLHRNPAMIGYVRNVWDLGAATGFIQRDPDTRQWVVPWTFWQKAASMLPWIGDLPPELRMVAPLSSLNLFLSQTVDVAGIPIPVPGLAPWAALPLKHFFSETTSPALTSYLFGFGYGTPIVPAWMEHAARVLFPGQFTDDRATSSAQDFLRLYQYLGTDKDENGNPLPTDVLAERAKEDARRVNAMLAVTGFIAPTAGQIRFPAELAAREQELATLRNTLGFEQGTDRFLQKYPDLTLLTIGKTVSDRFLAGLQAPRTPATEDVQKLFQQPKFALFAKRYPAWAAALVLQTSDQWDESSLAAFGAQIREGAIRYKGLDEFLTEGQSPGFWNAVDAMYSWYSPQADNLTARGLGDDNEAVIALKRQKAEALYDIYIRYPDYARQQGIRPLLDANGNLTDPAQATWDGDTGAPPPPIVYAQAREITQLKGFEQFPAIQGLKAYLDVRDRIAAEMSRLGVSNITDTTAQRQGLTAEYNQARDAIMAEFPDAARLIGAFFDNDLTGIKNSAEIRKSRMETRDPARYAEYLTFDTAWETIQDSASQPGLSKDEQNAIYEQGRDFVNTQYEVGNEWAVKLWYDSKSYSAQEQYHQGLIGRPQIFYSRFDWQLQGLKLSDRGAQWLDEINAARAEIARRQAEALASGETISTTPLYAAIDAWVNEHLPKDKTFRAAVDSINTWGAGLWQSGILDTPGKAGYLWNQLHDIVLGINQQAIQYGYHGDGLTFEDPDKKQAYYLARQALNARIAEYAADNDVFAEQVQDLQRSALRGDQLAYYLMPEIFFPLGGS